MSRATPPRPVDSERRVLAGFVRGRHAPEVMQREELVPSPCTVSPEVITEMPYFFDLEPDLRRRIDGWERPEDDEDPQYIAHLSTAPRLEGRRAPVLAVTVTGPTEIRMGANTPADIYVGRGLLFVFLCSRDARHPHRLVTQ